MADASFGASNSGQPQIFTDALLGIGGIFTSPILYSRDKKRMCGIVNADVDSAVNGLSIEQSSDGVNFDFVSQYTVLAGVTLNFDVPLVALYTRIVYTNNVGLGQTTFRLSAKPMDI